MKPVNPYRAAAGILVLSIALAFLFMVGVFVYVAIEEGWWVTVLKWIGGIAVLFTVGYIGNMWEQWEYEWDEKRKPIKKCEHGIEIKDGDPRDFDNHPCIECMGVNDNPDDEAREIYEAIQAEGQGRTEERANEDSSPARV